VTGYGCVTPLGRGPGALYDGWLAGDCAIRPVRRFDTSALNVELAGEIPDDAVPTVAGEPRGATVLRAAVDDAMEQAGLPSGFRPLVVCATAKGFLESGAQVAARDTLHDYRRPRTVIARHLTDRHGASAEASSGGFTVSTACASGTVALGLALAHEDLLREGGYDAIVCIGVDLISDFVYSGFASLQAVDREPCRPFDRSRAGMSPAEGAAAVVLETPEAAARRGAVPRGRLLGWGSAADGVHLTAPDREGRGMARAVRAALASAGIEAAELGHAHLHGTATAYNDAMEVFALRACLGEACASVPATTLKGTIGHTFGASGLVETVGSLEAVRRGVLPAIRGLTDPEPGLDLVTSPRDLTGHTFLKTSAGFGGFNAAVVLEGVPA